MNFCLSDLWVGWKSELKKNTTTTAATAVNNELKYTYLTFCISLHSIELVAAILFFNNNNKLEIELYLEQNWIHKQQQQQNNISSSSFNKTTYSLLKQGQNIQ